MISAWRWWLGPAALALVLALIFVDPFVGDWDALDYTLLALHGTPSSMALGRTLFIFANHGLWRIAHALFHLPAEDAYLLFKYAVVLQSPLAIIACWTLARELTRSVQASTVAALLISVSPIFIIYSGQVMTDVPSLLLLAVALVTYLRGVRKRSLWMMLAGAALLGAGVNMRETVAFYAPWLLIAPLACGWKPRGRDGIRIALSFLIFLIFALGPFAYLFIADVSNFRASWYGWREAMRVEAARHPVTIRNVLPFMLYFFVTSPLVLVALPVAALKEWRARGLSPLLALAAAGLFANLLLILNYSTTINWRYFLTGLPALTPLVADYLMRSQTARTGNVRRAFVSVLIAIVFIAIVFVICIRPTSREYVKNRALTKDYRARLALVPRDAVMISGAQTIAVNYWRGIDAGQWDTIGTGSGWPGAQLFSRIESYLGEDRRVFLDADPRWWSPCGWQSEETRSLAGLEQHFRFRRISDTIYEIRPPHDETAQDRPNLQRLLPEHRPEEVKKCAGVQSLS